MESETYRCIIDGANDMSLLTLKRALAQGPVIAKSSFQSSILTVEASSNRVQSVPRAIAIAKVHLRTRIK